MDKRVERLLKVIKAEFDDDAELFENMHDGTHKTPEGKTVPDDQLAREMEGGFVVTIHIMPKSRKHATI